MSIVRLARPEIQALTAYQAAEQVDNTIRLNANESPEPNTVGHFRRPLNRYPEVRPMALQSALARRFGCRTEQLLVTRGSSEAIDLIIRAFCRAGQDNIVVPSPTFSMYAHYAEIQGADVIEVPSNALDDFNIDVDALLAARTESTRVIFVCSPNNPTGSSISQADLARLIQSCSDRSAVVVDEAYVEFSREPSVIELLDANPNLLVLRTLSKALGFAGARCGAVAADAAVIRLLSAVQAPYALATPVVECVEDALQSDQLLAADKAVQDMVRERERLVRVIAEFDFVIKVWPSDANFFLIAVRDAQLLLQRCAENNVLLRNFGGDLKHCIRISVGSPADNDRLLQILGELEGSQHG